MSITEERPTELVEVVPEPAADELVGRNGHEQPVPPTSSEQAVSTPGDDEREVPALAELLRPVLAAALSAAAAGLVAGGIFGSWGARLTGLIGAFAGAFYVLLALRSPRTSTLVTAFPFLATVVGAFLLVTRGASPAELPTLVGDAIRAGRLFRPPVPFDPGWTPILFVLVAIIGFAVAWLGTALDRGKLAVAIPIPLAGLMLLTQPDDQQFLAGILAFLPILGALAVLFGGNADRARGLGGEFELKRAVRAGAAAIPLVVLLVALNSASFLFPDPVYDPNDQPQKPRAVPLSAARDRVLFEVATDSGITGPWRAGVLDIYDASDGFWKTSPRTLEKLPGAGVINPIRSTDTQLQIEMTVRDLGDSPVFPNVGGVTRVDFPTGAPGEARLDRRTQLIRMEHGRVPAGIRYVLSLPAYPTSDQLTNATVPRSKEFADQLAVDKPPAVVRDLLVSAPQTAWGRLDTLRQTMLTNITAKGAGAPVEVTAERVSRMFTKGAKASPFEIVAAEALLARWAGVPSRIGFGFDGLNSEKDVFTVRPRNSAQWLEVYFDDFGWIPLVGAPQKAETDLDTDPNTRFNPKILASDDVAVEVFLPYEVKDVKQLYQRIRDLLIAYAPAFAAAVASFFVWPFFSKWYRRGKRRRWATAIGPRAQIAVEYAELRDLASDLNVADIYATPLEYLFEVIDDEEHAEMAWLVSRTLYGDMVRAATEADVLAAERLGASLRRRLLRGQPVQAQIAALFSRASIKTPYSTEVPNIRLVRLPRLRLPRLRPRLRLPRLRQSGARA